MVAAAQIRATAIAALKKTSSQNSTGCAPRSALIPAQAATDIRPVRSPAARAAANGPAAITPAAAISGAGTGARPAVSASALTG